MHFLFILVLVITCRELPAEDLNRGLVLVYQGEAWLTNEYWTIVVNLNVTDYRVTIQDLAVQLNQLGREVDQTIHYSQAMKDEIIISNRRIAALNREIDEIEFMYPLPANKRVPRGLINLGGKLIKFMFGNADDEDLVRINHEISHLGNQQAKIVHVVKAQATIIKSSQESILENNLAINKLKNVSRIMQRELTKLEANMYNESAEIHSSLEAIQFKLRFNSALQMFTSIISNLENELTQIVNSINLASSHKLSPYIISPKELYEILLYVQPRLPTGLSLIGNLNKHDLPDFYETSYTRTALAEDGARIFVQLPLIKSERKFSIYRARALPINVATDISMFIEPQVPFLFISNDGTRFVNLDFDDIDHCRGELKKICPAHRAIQSRKDSCLSALYNGNREMEDRMCTRKLVKNPAATFIKTHGDSRWIYSVPKPVVARTQCPSGAPQVSSINGTGYLQVPPNCHVVIAGDTLLSDSNIQDDQVTQTMPRFHMPKVVLPDSNIPFRSTIFKTETSISQVTKILDSIPESKDRGMRVEDLENLVKSLDKQQVQQHTNILSYVVASLLLLMFLVLTTYFLYATYVKPSTTALAETERIETCEPDQTNSAQAIEETPQTTPPQIFL